MCAEFIDQPDSPLRVAKGDQFFPEQLDPNGRTIGLRQFQASAAGIQYLRITAPMGVPAPVLVTSSFSSGLNIYFPSFAYGAGFQPWALSSALILWTSENLKTLSAETDSFMPSDLRVSSITLLWISSLMLPSVTIPGKAAS